MRNYHQFQKQFNNFLYHLARCVEIIFAIIILTAIVCQAVPLIYELADISFVSLNMDVFSAFLANSLSLVVGLEFVKMLCKHSVETVVEVLLFATARQMVVEHLSTLETLIGVLAIALLFAVRKYLMSRTSSLQEAPHSSQNSSADP